jgi:hypothetical protein
MGRAKMSVIHDIKFADRVTAKLAELDDKAIEAITSGSLTDWASIRARSGTARLLPTRAC